MGGRVFLSSLGILQDSTCVDWSNLVDLRTQYNSLWTRLAACGHTPSVSKYGDPPYLSEIGGEPSGPGFFRILVQSTGSPETGYTCDASQLSFIVPPGSALHAAITSNATYGYITSPWNAGYPWYGVTTDPCNGCGKFKPVTVTPATETISCGTGSTTLYSGAHALSFIAAPNACGKPRDWYDTRASLNALIEAFPCAKYIAGNVGEDDCHETIDICCGGEGTLTGHYQNSGTFEGLHVLVLRWVDYLGNGVDNSAQLVCTLKKKIVGSEVAEIRARVEDAITHLAINRDSCDQCGSSVAPRCPGDNHLGIPCGTTLTYDLIAGLKGVHNTDDNGGCTACAEGFSGRICGCPWAELSSVMGWLAAKTCCIGETSCVCPCLNPLENGCTCLDADQNAVGCCCGCGEKQFTDTVTGETVCVPDEHNPGNPLDPNCTKCFVECQFPHFCSDGSNCGDGGFHKCLNNDDCCAS